MRKSRWRTPPAADTWLPPDRRPDSPSRIRLLVGVRVGLPCEPGRGFCQDLALELELSVLPAQLSELLALDTAQHVFTLALVRVGLGHPVADGLGRALELARELVGIATGAHQRDDLAPVLRRVWRS